MFSGAPPQARPAGTTAPGTGAGRRVRPRVRLGGVLLDVVELAGALGLLGEFLEERRTHQVVTVNLHFLAIARRDPVFRLTIEEADLAVADGMPLVWASRLTRQVLPERVTGVALVEASCRLAAASGRSVYLLGAAPGVAEMAAGRLRREFPGLRIAGVHSPPYRPLSPEEDGAIVRLIRAAEPDLLLVALGAPRQDLWIRAHRHELGVPVAMGIGGVLDILAGQVPRAPLWMQRSGLEWLHRLRVEPRRLWRRYLLDDVPMLMRLIVGATRPLVGATPGEPRGVHGA